MVGATESLDRSNVYNGVLVKGQSTADTEPLSALATYDDPASPVQWGGPFGGSRSSPIKRPSRPSSRPARPPHPAARCRPNRPARWR
jgi:hypothetical protein